MKNMFKISEETIKAQVLAHMGRLGIAPHNHELIADGELHRYTVEGDKATTKNGYYIIYTDGCPAWNIGSWRYPVNQNGKFDFDLLDDDEEQQKFKAMQNDPNYQAYIKRVEQERKAKIEAKRREGTRKAQEEFNSASPVTAEHPYLKRKGVTYIKNFRLGADGEVLVPLYNAKTGAFQSLQRIYPTPLSFGTDKLFASGASIDEACYTFNPEDAINERLQIVCEGIATGQTVFNMTGGRYRVTCAMSAGNLYKVVAGLRKRYPSTAFIMAADNDLQTEAAGKGNAGRKDAQEVVHRGLAKGMVIPYFKENEDGSDWNDYAFLHGEQKAAEEFNRQLDAVLSAPKVKVSEVKLFKGEGTEDDEDKPKLIFEQLCAMRKKFLAGRNIFYHGSIKHGEYYQYDADFGYWYRMTDADLQNELAKFLDYKETNHHIKELSMMVRLAITQSIRPRFNQKQVMCFRNGTLELDTGIFREHRPDDYTTWAVDYCYDKNAKCERFIQFLNEITNKDITRINFLYDMLGYILYPDNRLEKIFFLIGEGKNGKGVLLHTIEEIFRNANERDNSQSVTHVQPCDFNSPTSRILLEGSMLNIAHDINPNLKDCASYLKSLTSGDTITGNFKFCDSHSFTNRAKIICSSNHMIKIDDDSYGMRRRLMFCRFEMCFNNPDTHLKEKLFAERAGIFNLIYSAYRELLIREDKGNSNVIRESADQQEFLTEFATLANPVRDFWREYGEDYCRQHEVKKSAVFDDYRRFCEHNGLYAGTERAFHKAFFTLLKELNIEVDNTQRRRENPQSVRKPYYYVFKSATPYAPEPSGTPQNDSRVELGTGEQKTSNISTTDTPPHSEQAENNGITHNYQKLEHSEEVIRRIISAGIIEPQE